MAQYQSSLTGPEIDAALTDMARHDSEAWAVGTRDGEAVSSLDITYHNNAEYYATKADAAAARAESAVPAGTAGAVFFDQAQTLTDAQKLQAQTNIGATASPAPNLLDNAWFLINQRGAAAYSTAGHSIDRWYLNSGAFSWDADGITATSAATIFQYYEKPRWNSGDYLRVSVLLSDGTVYTSTNTATSAYQNVLSGSLRVRIESSGLRAAFQIQAGFLNVKIRALKIERQGPSTLAMDAAPDPSIELLKCQRYLYVIGSRAAITQLGIGHRWSSAGAYRLYIPTPVQMRAAPTVTVSDVSNLKCSYRSTTTYSCTSLTTSNANSYNNVMLSITCATMTQDYVGVGLYNSEKMIISAELSA